MRMQRKPKKKDYWPAPGGDLGQHGRTLREGLASPKTVDPIPLPDENEEMNAIPRIVQELHSVLSGCRPPCCHGIRWETESIWKVYFDTLSPYLRGMSLRVVVVFVSQYACSGKSANCKCVYLGWDA